MIKPFKCYPGWRTKVWSMCTFSKNRKNTSIARMEMASRKLILQSLKLSTTERTIYIFFVIKKKIANINWKRIYNYPNQMVIIALNRAWNHTWKITSQHLYQWFSWEMKLEITHFFTGFLQKQKTSNLNYSYPNDVVNKT